MLDGDKMMNKPRMMIGIALGILMLCGTVYIAMNWDEMFLSKVDIEYPDGCVETYINAKLTTEECTDGRMLAEKELEDRQQQNDNKWSFNVTQK
jgi:hypothetical protein